MSRAAREEEESEEEREVFEEDFELLDAHDEVIPTTKKSSESAESRKEKEKRERIKQKPVRFYGAKSNSKVVIPTSKADMKRSVQERREKRTVSLGERAEALEKKSRK